MPPTAMRCTVEQAQSDHYPLHSNLPTESASLDCHVNCPLLPLPIEDPWSSLREDIYPGPLEASMPNSYPSGSGSNLVDQPWDSDRYGELDGDELDVGGLDDNGIQWPAPGTDCQSQDCTVSATCPFQHGLGLM